MADFIRHIPEESEHGYQSYENLRRAFKSPLMRNVFKDNAPENLVNAFLDILPKVDIKRVHNKDAAGIAPLDIVLGQHGFANPITSTAHLDDISAPEELLHLIDSKLGDGWFTDKPEYRKAVDTGTKRMADAYTRPQWAGRRGVSVRRDLPNNGRMRQLLRESPYTPFHAVDKEGLLGAHGTLYELENQIIDWPNFDKGAASYKEALPAILDLPSDTAYKYYPEAMEVINKFLDNIPYSETNPHDFKLPK